MSQQDVKSSEPLNGNNKSDDPEGDLEDDIVEHPSDVIGGFGPLQRTIVIYLIVIYLVAPFNNSHIVFTAPNADFFCIDIDPATGKQVNLTNACRIGNSSDAPPCRVFDHDRTHHKRTLVNEFDLVCDKAWYPSLSQTMHQLGYAVSGILLGVISDKKGRFFCAKLAIVLEIISGFGQAFSPNIYWYFVTRFFIGIAAYGRFLNGYVLVAEWVGPKIRGKMSAVYEIGWFFGKIILPGVYFLIPDYYTVQLGVTTAEIFLFLGYIFIVKESPRWQLTHGRFKEAEKTLHAAALQKGVYTEKEINEKIQKLKAFTIKEHEILREQNLHKPSIFDIWKDPQLLKTSLILYYSWFSMSLVGYGSYLNIGNLGGSLYWNVFFASISSAISNALLYYFIRKTDRRKLMQRGIILKALFLLGLLSCSFHDYLIPGRIVFFNMSFIVSWLAYGTVYVYTTEFFPTQMRQTAMGVCSLFSRFGSMSAPFIKELTLATHLAVPFALFIVLSLTNVITWHWLPNTTDIQLPDTILQSKKVEEEAKEVIRRNSRIASLKSGDGIELKHR